MIYYGWKNTWIRTRAGMTTEARKAALDAILERIHLEGYENYDDFAKRTAVWFEENSQSELTEYAFVEEFRTGNDFHKYNQTDDREDFLSAVYADAINAIERVPSLEPKRLYIEDIDSFSRVIDIGPDELEIEGPVLEVSEADVKEYLREILGEQFEQPDWGGEINDLFTNQVKINGERVDTAFMLKGPSVNPPMQIADAGTRGDQFQRLFQSHADLFIIQYNGKIEDRTYGHIKNLAKVTNAGMYCIIDGIDTARLLKAYDKI